MNKTIITLIAVAIMLTACNSKGEDKNNNEVTEKNEQLSQTEGGQEVRQENDQNQSNESSNHEESTSLPEYNNIIEQIDNKEFNFQTITDNEGKRVLLLIDKNGVEQYKSIYIKYTNRLKIIKINGEGLIFNEIIEGK
ncbi:hypothetical protein MKZ08_11095 [Viridibacillus sp. FSL R5-0477]|uniref:Lipoprotein n=1 Tax=Viridibacillus arenosi FSL R5-213 TaxID=1227360 RepID=W4F0W3_9BACL|nr:hypothetical protein [Viridibacillus arenosi]ETT86463.1 hypothetical protein C176_07112 [Viridibacillus arenosi FSL R5-213]OMC91704.1 hypothetical protein BK137_07230 [Viridibacillus arenosi]